jgi:hypothetical protein
MLYNVSSAPIRGIRGSNHRQDIQVGETGMRLGKEISMISKYTAAVLVSTGLLIPCSGFAGSPESDSSRTPCDIGNQELEEVHLLHIIKAFCVETRRHHDSGTNAAHFVTNISIHAISKNTE